MERSNKSRVPRVIAFVAMAVLIAAFIWFLQRFVQDRRATRAHVEIANTLIQKGLHDQAEEYLKKALAIDPESSPANLRLGNLYLRRGQQSLAQKHLEKAFALSPQDANIANNLGSLYGQQGNYELAVEKFTQAIELLPDGPGGYNNLAWLHATCPDANFRDGKKGVTLATKACDLTGWIQFSPLDTLATAHAEAGEFDEAIRWQIKALELVPDAQRPDLLKRMNLYRNQQAFHESRPE